ncbi:UNVERIFIED_CONTAM: hypothetical protein Sradi_3875200 [Sesamum radiatum]|uniref:Uncharacterized protein n=1 Tax=Sesamum radiatum TaxID=300843 RepID=A0AAW2Q2H1_SESRA
MAVNEGLVAVLVQFFAVAGIGCCFLASSWTAMGVSCKCGGPISVVKLRGDSVREAKHGHLLDEKSDMISAEGLRSPWTVWLLGEFIQFHNLALVFLSETKCKRHKSENLKKKFNLFGINVD